MSYILITSVYNEEKCLAGLFKSVMVQSVQPNLWILVDDGSTDNSPALLDEFGRSNSNVLVLHKENCGFNIPGKHAMVNFSYALSHLPPGIEWAYLGHLDADCIPDRPDYYEQHLARMDADKSIGIATGITYYIDGRIKKIVWHEPWHTTGALKFYRRQCFEQISPIPADIGWDGIDETKAMYYGWKTVTFFDLEVNHLGKSRDIARKTSTRHFYFYGQSAYRRGRRCWFVLIKTLKTCREDGLRNAMLYLQGYCGLMARGEDKILEDDIIRFADDFQLQRLPRFLQTVFKLGR